MVKFIDFVGGAITFCNISITQKFGLCTQTLPPSVLLGEWLETRLSQQCRPSQYYLLPCVMHTGLFYI